MLLLDRDWKGWIRTGLLDGNWKGTYRTRLLLLSGCFGVVDLEVDVVIEGYPVVAGRGCSICCLLAVDRNNINPLLACSR